MNDMATAEPVCRSFRKIFSSSRLLDTVGMLFLHSCLGKIVFLSIFQISDAGFQLRHGAFQPFYSFRQFVEMRREVSSQFVKLRREVSSQDLRKHFQGSSKLTLLLHTYTEWVKFSALPPVAGASLAGASVAGASVAGASVAGASVAGAAGTSSAPGTVFAEES